MDESSNFLTEKELLLKNKLEVKLNDLEKKHLESKEREAQAVGFLERRLKQVELEHKTELKLRRQLRYEVNNLRKRLLETYKLYTDTLEQNELMRNEIELLKNYLILNNERKLCISREVELQILDLSNRKINTDNENIIERIGLNSDIKDNFDIKEEKIFASFEGYNNKNSILRRSIKNERNIFSINRNMEKNKKLIEKQVFKSILNGETTKNSFIRSERARDWLNQIEELYKPLEYSRFNSRKLRNEFDTFSNIGISSSSELIENIPIEEKYFSDDDCMTENTEKMITNTGFIIDQINQQERELSSLLSKTFISNNKYFNLSKNGIRENNEC